MGVATLGFQNGPSIDFRIDPNSIDWNFTVLTNVIETLGGRVIQVVGSQLSDLLVKGSLGEVRGSNPFPSWQVAESFFAKIQGLMDFQSKGATQYGRLGQPAIFTYPPLDLKFLVYIKDYQDPDGGGGVTHRPGKFSYSYNLTLFIYPESSGGLKYVGGKNSIYSAAQARAINNYLARISDGIGWHASDTFNGAGAAAASITARPPSGVTPSSKTRSSPPGNKVIFDGG